jgi:dihydroxyacid dehydratase/phosphogluconate dehydratase
MHASVLATAYEYNIPVVYVVWNNYAYGSIRGLQRGYLGGRELATDFKHPGTNKPYNPDFAAMARAAGIAGVSVGRASDLAEAVRQGIASGKPCVVMPISTATSIRGAGIGSCRAWAAASRESASGMCLKAKEISSMTRSRLRPEDLRSHRWFGGGDLSSQGHRSRALQMGYARNDFAGKPVIGIINTWSDLLPCHAHFRTRAEEVKRGVWQAGGFPVELPVMAVSETFQKPTSMMYRNFLAMETEEMLRSHPIDGAVLMGGCDKTTPGLIMGATSMGLPFIYMPAGPMLRGNWKGEQLGSGTDRWKYWAELRAGRITDDDWREVEEGIARSYGHCMTMGTASTMTSAAETLGLTLPGAASVPAADSGHPRMATASGRRIVEMVWEDLRPAGILTPAAFDNAITVVHALSGSTNALIHLIAMAGRAGVEIKLERFDELAQNVPVLANLRPAGKYLMEDFYYAGGCEAARKLKRILNLQCPTVADAGRKHCQGARSITPMSSARARRRCRRAAG